MIGISKDSAQSHRDFIAKHKLVNMTLLADEKSEVTKLYKTDHWLLPVSRRVYIILDKQRNIVYRKDTGFGLLEDQTQTLIGEIDRKIQ